MSKIVNMLSAIGVVMMAATPLVAIGGSMAHAQDALTPAHVQVADLDFNRASDVATFRQRVDVAAHSLCADDNGPSRVTNTGCSEAVYDEAVSKLGSAQRQALASTTGAAMNWTVASR